VEKINAYQMSVGRPIEEALLRYWHRWGDNRMCNREKGHGRVHSFQFVKIGWSFVKTVIP
jgi:hypothetical protein